MSCILVLADQRKNKVSKSTFELVSEALRLGEKASLDVFVAIAGTDVKGEADRIAAYGATKILVVEDEQLANFLNAPYVSAFKAVIEKVKPRLVMAPTSEGSKDYMPGLIQAVGGAGIMDCSTVAIDGSKVTVTRPLMAAKAFSTVETEADLVMMTIRSGSFDANEPDESRKAEVEEVPYDAVSLTAVFKELLSVESDRVSLDEASVVVTAGRGVKDKDGVALIEKLADAFGGAVGATRALTEQGIAPATLQIGQTGKVVTPELYIACGVSGAVQHTAGMNNSKVIVAINKDAEAPIFNVADYGLVGDLFEIVPKLIEAVEEIKANS